MMNKLRKQIVGAVCVAMLFSFIGNTLVQPINVRADNSDSMTNIEKYEPAKDFIRQSFELYPNGKESEQTVTLDGMMPEGATAEAVDVTNDYSNIDNFSDNTLAYEEEQNVTVLAAYNITITDGEDEFQPDKSYPIFVEIATPDISADETTELWHIKDNGEREQITNFTIEDGKISFYAMEFSIYAIVVDENVVPLEDSGWQRISSLSELETYGSSGLYLGNPAGYYITDEQYTVSGTRTGIKKTKPASTNVDDAISLGAVPYYFEATENDKYYIYCLDENNSKKYVKQNSNSLSFVSTTSDASAFSIEEHTNNDAYDFIIAGSGNGNSRYCWNQQGNANGNGFASYSGTTDNNARLYFWYHSLIEDDPYELNNKTYGLMNLAGVASGNALMADDSENHVALIDYVIRTDDSHTTYYVSEESDITMWTFHSITEDKYTLSAEVNGETKYLKINDDGNITFVDEANASQIKVTPGSEKNSNKIKLSSGSKTITFDSGSFKAQTLTSDTTNAWLNFVELSTLSSNDYTTYSAEKISVSDAVNGQKVIVYTRVWNDDAKTYEFYAVDHDGSLVHCYERGDNIMWLGNQINTLLWDFTEYYYDGTSDPNYYYELYNSYSGKYLAPQIKGGQVLSGNTIGINMPGRKNGEYYSDILAWNDTYYTYAGIKADVENDKIVSCPGSKAETFYFAKIETPVSELTKVDTINNTDYGITMKMIDYPSREYQAAVIGNDNGDNTFKPGLLSTDLKDNGYPTATNAVDNVYHSLYDLYDGATEVNHLFIQSIYKSSGYFEFDSCQNFATLIKDDGSVGTDFTVYKELGTKDGQPRNTLKHGQFFPYDTITAGVYSTSNPENLYSALAQLKSDSAGLLPDSDPRKYEKLHTVGNNPNYYNGMELEASFVQTPSGHDAWGHDMIFEFTGDDDFWLYVDGELVIDLGGIHSALGGNVNFATGEVTVNGNTKTLKDIFRSNYLTRNPSATTEQINEYLSNYFSYDDNSGNFETVFKDYSSHSMKIFYMERGAGASNLHMRFNLSYVTPGNVILTKNVTGTNDLDFDLVQYPYQIWYVDQENGEEKLLSNTDENISVTYQNSTKKVNYKESYTPPNSDAVYNSVYFINPSQSAEIHFPDNTIKYRIIECGINTEVYDYVKVNDNSITGSEVTGSQNRSNYDSGLYTVEENQNIVFENHVDPEGLRTLTIEKQLYDENGDTLTSADDPTTFSFRLYLSNGVDDTLQLANMCKYHVKTTEGYYCTWDADNQRFASTMETDISSFTTDEDKEAITFETSMNGSISKIPAGYKIEVPNLPVGVKFKLEERESEIPLGYTFVEYERDSGTYSTDDGDTINTGTVRANESPSMTVKNKRGWGLSANKIWSDNSFTSSHAPIYTAVYIDDTLLNGTVRQIKSPQTSVQYFFDSIETGKSFSDYKICEVTLTNPTVNEDGTVLGYDDIIRLNDGDLTTINALTNGSSSSSPFSYAVTYSKGSVTGVNNNVRSDTITNTRDGGIVITLYDMKTKEKLANGVFTLKQGDNNLGTFTSDANGRVTILYDFERDIDYILTETKAPTGYIGLPNPVTFSINANDEVTVTGNDAEWADGYKSEIIGDKLIAYIDIYNKPFTLTAMKIDSANNELLANAHFALYRGINSSIGNSMVKDNTPISGYDDLVTDENGVIPKIDNTLSPGTYYLTEKTPPKNYESLEADLIFTISPLGDISIVNVEYNSFLQKTDSTNECSYTISIPNTLISQTADLTITKSVQGSLGNKVKDFTFTITVEYATSSDEYEWSKNGISQTDNLQSGGTFTMKDGDEVIITLPINSSVTITENNEGYETTFKLGNADSEDTKTKTFSFIEDTLLEVTNTQQEILPTGIKSNLTLAIILLISSIICVKLILQRNKKYKSTIC